MMNECSKRHSKLLSLIFTLNRLSKTSVIRIIIILIIIIMTMMILIITKIILVTSSYHRVIIVVIILLSTLLPLFSSSLSSSFRPVVLRRLFWQLPTVFTFSLVGG